MKARIKRTNVNAAYLSTKEAQDYLGIGRDALTVVAERAGAVIRIGRVLRYSKARLDEYMESKIGDRIEIPHKERKHNEAETNQDQEPKAEI